MNGIDFGRPLDGPPLSIGGGHAGEGDIFGAAIEQMRLVDNSDAAWRALEEAYAARTRAVKAATGVDLGNPLVVQQDRLAGDDSRQALAARLGAAGPQFSARVVSRQQQAYADRLLVLAKEFPQHVDVIKATVPVEKDAEDLARQADEHLATLMASNPSWSAALAGFAGGAVGSLRDPMVIGSLALGGGPGAARTVAGRILTTAFTEALVNGATTAAAQPAVQAWREKAGLPAGLDQAATNVLFAAGLGGVLGAGGRAIGEGVGAAARRVDARKALEDFALSHPELSDQARRALKGDTGAAAASLAEIRDVMPPPVRAAIDAAEEGAARDAQRQAELAHMSARRAERLQALADEAVRLKQMPAALPVEDTPRINRIVNSLAPKAESIADPEGVLGGRKDFSAIVEELRGRAPAEAVAPRRPLATLVRRLGGVDPDGPVGRELKAAGLDSRNSPGLFRRAGRGSLDNVPFDEVPPELQPSLHQDGNGYVDQQAFIDGLEAELRVSPDTVPRQSTDELRNHLSENGIEPEQLTDDELAVALADLDEAETRFLAAETNDMGLGTDERVSFLPPGVTRRAYTAEVVREILRRAGEGIPDDAVRAAADLHLFEGEDLEDAIGFALSDAAGVRRTLPPQDPELAALPHDPPEVMADAPVDPPDEGGIEWMDAAKARERERSAEALREAQPDRSLDELYEGAPQRQLELVRAGQAIAVRHGVDFIDPGIKDRANAAAKMERKGYVTTGELTDVVRGAFVVKTPRQADDVVSDLATSFDVADEGWTVTHAGYMDRKVLVAFPDGSVGEVQVLFSSMRDAKAGGGHQLYETARALEANDPESPHLGELIEQQRALYQAAADAAGDDWSAVFNAARSAPGKRSANTEAETGTPLSDTSTAEAGFHADEPRGTNQAFDPMRTAGRPSQSISSFSITPDMRAEIAAVNGGEEIVPFDGDLVSLDELRQALEDIAWEARVIEACKL